jgi:uncharacterized pyridoxamine 5'-phosphate oxidase family protein
MIAKRLQELFKNTRFIYLATSDLQGTPNAVPKYLLKIEGDALYVVDYVFGRTWKNIKVNPRVSIPVMNSETLIGYRVNGLLDIVKERKEKSLLVKEFSAKTVKSSVQKVIDAVRSQTPHRNFEVIFPDKAVIYKIKVLEVTDIGPTGKLVREKS